MICFKGVYRVSLTKISYFFPIAKSTIGPNGSKCTKFSMPEMFVQLSNSKKVSNFSESVVNQSDLFRVSVIPSVTKCNTQRNGTNNH